MVDDSSWIIKMQLFMTKVCEDFGGSGYLRLKDLTAYLTVYTWQASTWTSGSMCVYYRTSDPSCIQLKSKGYRDGIKRQVI